MLMSKFLKWFDEYQPNCYNQQHSRVLKVLNAFPDVIMLYRKSIYQKLLESKDSTIIEILFRLPPLNESTLPLSLLLDASKYANVTRNWYNMATSMIMQIYSIDSNINREKIEKDFTTRSDLIREKKFSFQTIREIIQVFLKGEAYSQNNSDKLIFYLCLLTFQNLTRDDILELKDDYLKLIPYIYKYSSSSRINSFSYTGLDRKSRIESNLSIATRYSHRVQSQPNYLYYLIQYYGMDIIEKESVKFYLDWKSKPKDHSEYTTLFTFAQYMIDSQYIRDNLQVLYNYFWLAIESNFGNYNYYLNIWGNYIERFGIVHPKYFDNLRDFLIDKCKIIITNSLHPTLYEFYNSLLSANTQYTISNFKQIVTEYANKPYNFMVYLNQLLMKPTILQAIKTSDNSKQLYNEIKNVGSMSSVDYCYLSEFFMAYKKVYEYSKMIPKFINAINSNKKWLIKDESFFAPILRFYSLIKTKNPNEANQLFEKTIRSFIKVLESGSSTVKLDIIYPYLNDINEISYLFKQIKQILNDSDQYIEIFKHFIELDQIDQKYIQENLDAALEMGFKFNNQIIRTLKIIEGLSRYTNLDSQILKSTNQFLKVMNINEQRNFTMVYNLLSSLLDISSGYEGFVDSLFSIYFCTNNISQVVDSLNKFDSIHQMVFYKKTSHIDIPQQDIIRIHNQLVRGIINKWNLVDLPLQSNKMILMYFKPLKSLETLLQDNLLKQFKSFDIASKKCILRYIKQNEIRVLEYLNDFNLTGFTFDHNKIEQNINNQTPYVQNLIIQKFVSFITRDKSTKPSDILLLSLVSKLFFKSVCLTFQHYKIKLPQKLPDKYQLSSGMWSFMSLGCYHLNYKDLERFHYQDVEDIFYQISSLTIHTPMMFLVEREMSNLTHLKIEIRFEMSLSCTLQMMNHCFKLQSFQLSISSIPLNSIIITLIDNIIQKLITNNSSTLNQLNFEYPACITPVDLIEPMEAIFEQITNHQITNPTTFKHQISLNFIGRDNNYNFPNLVSIRSLTTSCTHLILENYDGHNNILNQLKPNLFLNLRSIFIHPSNNTQLSLQLAHFIMSPEIELESLTILCYPIINQKLEVLKKPTLQKVKIIFDGEQLLLEHINPIFSVANQNHTIKSIKIYGCNNQHMKSCGRFKKSYQFYKSPCISDVHDHQFNFGDFHPINNYHFIKY
ncbi:hypothetical protein DLAC_01663 [Tieghemostelium lacteum]|uniref:Uncharacterized protein n=1 Tax=Tieghemostelium lacteum TaxID=361077 RepID=A0A152A6D0_TIELA|nr:hypothetical protein DLAC_01663 [Tieghemostelium lacteum]|eukprot:KYR01661.1 hypothetical protein DLAC_01663 [Tieghemostelium lacteum]